MLSWNPPSETSAPTETPPLALGPLTDEFAFYTRRSVVPPPRFLTWFQAVRPGDEKRLGCEAVALGEMHGALAHRGVRIPLGFATSGDAFDLFLDSRVPAAGWKSVRSSVSMGDRLLLQGGTLRTALRRLLGDEGGQTDVAIRSRLAMELVRSTPVPDEVEAALAAGYRRLRELYGDDLDLAVRCGREALGPGLPLFEEHGRNRLDVRTCEDLYAAWRDCCARAFDEDALRSGAGQERPALPEGVPILVMKLVRSDIATSGFVVTRDPVTQDDATIRISAVHGVGGARPPGPLIPDALVLGKESIRRGLPLLDVHASGRANSALATDEVVRLSSLALSVEDQYGRPVLIEWVQDGYTGDFMVLQVHPLVERRAQRFGGRWTSPPLERW